MLLRLRLDEIACKHGNCAKCLKYMWIGGVTLFTLTVKRKSINPLERLDFTILHSYIGGVTVITPPMNDRRAVRPGPEIEVHLLTIRGGSRHDEDTARHPAHVEEIA
jgi:hypothetical protein